MRVTTFLSIGGGLCVMWSSALNLSAIGYEEGILPDGMYHGEYVQKEKGTKLLRKYMKKRR